MPLHLIRCPFKLEAQSLRSLYNLNFSNSLSLHLPPSSDDYCEERRWKGKERESCERITENQWRKFSLVKKLLYKNLNTTSSNLHLNVQTSDYETRG